MKKIKNLKLILVSLVILINSWSNIYAQEWEKIINYGDGNDAFSVCQTKDGYYWVAGIFYNHTKGSEDLALTKLDKNGNEIFHKILEGKGYGTGISPTSENGVLFSGLVDNETHFFKADNNGNVLWEKNMTFNSGLNEIDANRIFFTTNDKLGLLDKDGNTIWEKNIKEPLDVGLISQKILPSGMIVAGITKSTPRKLVEYLYDFNGNLLTETIVFQETNTDNIYIFKLNNDGSYIITNPIYDNGKNLIETALFKAKDNNIIWKKSIGKSTKNIISTFYTDFISDKNENLVFAGIETLGNPSASTSKVNAIISVFDKDGNFKSMKRYGGILNNDFSGITEDSEGYYLACGWHNAFSGLDNKYPARIVKTKADELSKLITGKVVFDENSNCAVDSLEKNPNSWLIEAKSSNNTSEYGVIGSDGVYSILTDKGTQTLKVKIPSPYYSQICDSTIVVGDSLTNYLNLFLNKKVDCPYMNVDLATQGFRPCTSSNLVVNFCNHGSALANGAYIDVNLDPNLTYQSATIAGTAQGNNSYRFALGDIPIDSCGQFSISVNVACDLSLVGKTLCNTAHIYPDVLCNGDNGKIQVVGSCDGTNIKFDIKNNSSKAMNGNKQYFVIEDHVMFMQGNFKLNENGVLPVSFQPKSGKTYRLIAEQTNPFFGNLATAAFENCNSSATASKGFINQFDQGDDSPFDDTDCRVVTSSLDPNDKQAVPQGIRNEHFIAKNTDIEYMIRFQNTGTDTAFLVVIKDTLSSFLDPASIVPGASSHPYSFDLTDRGIAKFVFANINLPHEKADKEGSNGFVKFRIKQKHNVANGTVIKNNAAIYFDYNAPVITNTTFHTIGESWLMLIPTKEIDKEKVSLKVYPNPFNEHTTIELIQKETFNNLTFNVFDSNGRLIRSEKFNNNTIDFYRNDLQNGFYFYEVKNEGSIIGNGKLVIF